jgi:PadR family transcriptional regulator AphA
MLKYVLLGFLNYQSASGYDLKQWMDVSTSNFWHARQSQIYTTLKKLEQDGLVVSHVESQETRPDRRVYEITAEGQADLKDWLSRPLMTIEPRKEPLLLKIFFSAQLDPQTVLTQLHLQHNLHSENLEKHRTMHKEIIRQFAETTGLSADAQFWEATRRFGELYEEAYISWLLETIAMLERNKK